jgi:fimbrial chaperone protein
LLARNAPLAALVAGLGLLLGPGRAFAQLEVTPIQVELTNAEPNAIVTLHNRGSDPVRYQVSVFAWQQGPKGEMQLSRTKDVLFFPGLLSLGPDERRNLRVSSAASFGAVEKTYRLFVEELPGAPRPPNSGVKMLTRVGIPVYLEPRTPLAGADVTALSLAGRRFSFVLRNTGNVRLRPEVVRVTARAAGGELVFDEPLSSWYVLAASDRRFELDVPAASCARVRTLTVSVGLPGGPLERQLAVSGACGP